MEFKMEMIGNYKEFDRRKAIVNCELMQARIPAVEPDGEGEYKDLPQGQLADWRFRRHWNYWTANAPEGRGFSKELAKKLHDQGKAYNFRAGGYSGGGVSLSHVVSEQETVDTYHIDSQENLNDFVQIIYGNCLESVLQGQVQRKI